MKRAAILLVIAGTIASAVVIAGPLAPPAGPIAATYKTLADIEPRVAISTTNTPGDADSMMKITSPGSYYLPADLDCLPSHAGIVRHTCQRHHQ